MGESSGNKLILSSLMIKQNKQPEKAVYDDDGYTTQILGAFNVYNAHRTFYPMSMSEDMFKDSSVFMRQVLNGTLFGEDNHPEFQLNKQPVTEQRYRSIDSDMVCMHIKKIELEEVPNLVINQQFGAVVLVKGLIKPYGPRGKILQEQLDNPNINTCFSLRSIIEEGYIPGVGKARRIVELITYDKVPEPGVKFATTWYGTKGIAYAVESLQEQVLLKDSKNLKEVDNLLRSIEVYERNVGSEALRGDDNYLKCLLNQYKSKTQSGIYEW